MYCRHRNRRHQPRHRHNCHRHHRHHHPSPKEQRVAWIQNLSPTTRQQIFPCLRRASQKFGAVRIPMVCIMLQLQTCLCSCKTGRMSANIGCLVARCACWPLGSDTHVPTNSGAPKHVTWMYASYTNPTHPLPHSERTRHTTTMTTTEDMRTDSRSAHRVQRSHVVVCLLHQPYPPTPPL